MRAECAKRSRGAGRWRGHGVQSAMLHRLCGLSRAATVRSANEGWGLLMVWRVLICLVLGVAWRASAEGVAPPRETFDDLARWEPLTFPKIARHSSYGIVTLDGTNRVLKAASDNSASGLRLRGDYDPQQFPRLRWRWRVDNVFSKASADKKAGDDYPLRLYILFTYDPAQAGFAQRATYALARRRYGEYPPHSSLNYVWANQTTARRTWESPYTDRARMVAVAGGADATGQWQVVEVDVRADYREAFGEDPPATRATLAIMSDADNTGQRAVAYLDDLEMLPAAEAP